MTIGFDRTIFFDAMRTLVSPTICATQVAGCEAILAEATRRQIADTRPLAYMLATTFWETGRTMQPVREMAEGRGKPYGLADPRTHQIYYGRGLVQLTWKANYARMSEVCGEDLVADPDLALRLDIAVKILFEGMLLGLFTGRRLTDFFSKDVTDWVGARRIVNGTDRAETIAVLARHFDTALCSSLHSSADQPAPSAAPTLVARLKTFFRV